MEDPLLVLRASVQANAGIKMLTTTDASSGDATENITEAVALLFPNHNNMVVPLDQITRFVPSGEESGVDMRTIYHCVLTRDLNLTDYISASEERNIKNLKFLDRTNLLTWLDGAADTLDNLGASEDTTAGTAVGLTAFAADTKSAHSLTESLNTGKQSDPHLEEIYSHERVLVDYNMQLHGTKSIDFSFAATMCKQEIIVPLKGRGASATTSSRSSGPAAPAAGRTASSTAAAPPFQKKGKDPIILVSPSASSALNIANIKQFLENGVYEPVASTSGASNIIRLSRESPRLGRSSVRFIVVDSVDKFKPEYWDRVVAVFVTGQQWQLSPYKWSDPNILFRHVLGFGVVFQGEKVPTTLQNWHVSIEQLDKNHRFRDREVVERIWDRIETYMLARGWQAR